MLIMFFRDNTRLLYANIFIKMDIEKDCILNKRGKGVSIVIDIILTAVFNVNSGERVSLVSGLSLTNCTVKNREDILLVYVDPFEKLCANTKLGQENNHQRNSPHYRFYFQEKAQIKHIH